jgi:hypothetical protein
MVLPLVIAGGWLADKFGNGGDAAKGVGGAVDDFSRVGKNKFQATPYANDWGYAQGLQEDAMGQAGQAGMGGSWAQDEMMTNRGAQAAESAHYSDREAMARDYDQQGALQLQREAAMGMAPSEAAYQMQSGLNQAAAQQTSAAGSARGSAALAMAQGNAAANTANMQQQTFSDAGRLRAQEMAQARDAYMGGASQMRQQDQGRLQQGNEMANRNADRNDAYRMGMGGLANSFGQTQQGARGQAIGAEMGMQQQNSENYNQAQGLNAGRAQGEADRQKDVKSQYMGMASSLAGAAAKGAGG